MSTALSSGSPTRSVSIRALSLATSRSATPSCTRMREPAQQTWPWLNQIASTTPSTTLSRSASWKTMNGDFPPSSSESFLPAAGGRGADDAGPTSVEPVNAILSTSGWATSASPVRPSPVMMLTTPGGSPTSSQSSANRSAVSEVNSAGLSTTVFPIASAGAIFHASMSSGKFHGMIWPDHADRHATRQLPLHELRPAGVVVEVPRHERHVDVARLADRLAVVERLEHGEQPAVLLHLPRERVEVPRPRRARRAPTTPGCAARAARTARSTSAAVACVSRASGLPVAGFSVSNVSPPGSVHAPPMKSPNRRLVALQPGLRRRRPPPGRGRTPWCRRSREWRP